MTPQHPTHSIIVVDGCWKVGKSTLCHDICVEAAKPALLKEPAECPDSASTARADWYRTAHLKRIAIAKELVNRGFTVVMERGLISTLAYHFDLYSSDYDSLMEAHGYTGVKHILILGNDRDRAEEDKTDFGDAIEMQDCIERAEYMRRLLLIGGECIESLLVLRSRYWKARDWSAIKAFI